MRIILYNCVSVKEVETYIRMLIHCFFFDSDLLLPLD